jgi:hypothetical protein
MDPPWDRPYLFLHIIMYRMYYVLDVELNEVNFQSMNSPKTLSEKTSADLGTVTKGFNEHSPQSD